MTLTDFCVVWATDGGFQGMPKATVQDNQRLHGCQGLLYFFLKSATGNSRNKYEKLLYFHLKVELKKELLNDPLQH